MALMVSCLHSSQRALNADNGRDPGSAPGGLCCHQESLQHPEEGGRPRRPLPVWGGHAGRGRQDEGRPGDERGHHHYAAHPPLPAASVREPQPGPAGEGQSVTAPRPPRPPRHFSSSHCGQVPGVEDPGWSAMSGSWQVLHLCHPTSPQGQGPNVPLTSVGALSMCT